jgi:apolipoprotein N-acyltransferase
MSKYVRKGANLICIITNDGWWDNTPGHKQHMSYARLRAIETRTWLARSANTGISCFIDPYGAIVDSLPWDTAGAIKAYVPPGSSPKTFFTRNGDILSWLMTLISTVLISWASSVYFQRRRKSKHISNV